MTNPLIEATNKITDRIRKEYGVEPRLGLEWEFILRRSEKCAFSYSKGEMEAVVKELRSALAGLPLNRFYVDGHALEVTTSKLEPAKAAAAMQAIQERVSEFAKAHGYYFSSHPARFGPCGLHVNSSLWDLNTLEPIMQMPTHSLVFGGMAANIIESILRINKETPLWSWSDKSDMSRLKKSVGLSNVPRTFSLGNFDTHGLHIKPSSDSGSVRLEERFPGARMDPYVAAFRTVLAYYHGLESPKFIPDAQIKLNNIRNFGPIHHDWNKYKSSHLRKDSIPEHYVGDLYDAETLRYIDERARHPYILELETPKQRAAPLIYSDGIPAPVIIPRTGPAPTSVGRSASSANTVVPT